MKKCVVNTLILELQGCNLIDLCIVIHSTDDNHQQVLEFVQGVILLLLFFCCCCYMVHVFDIYFCNLESFSLSPKDSEEI